MSDTSTVIKIDNPEKMLILKPKLPCEKKFGNIIIALETNTWARADAEDKILDEHDLVMQPYVRLTVLSDSLQKQIEKELKWEKEDVE